MKIRHKIDAYKTDIVGQNKWKKVKEIDINGCKIEK